MSKNIVWKPLKPFPWMSKGNHTYDAIQNKSNTLDLFIREGLQNSLDAVRDGELQVIVDISRKEYISSRVSRYFQSYDESSGISKTLYKKYADSKQVAYVLRDSNTTGLNGEGKFCYGEEKSNFSNLVYGIGDNDKSIDKGGSHGCGKTIFLRLGIGLVIYYTRVINPKGNFENRLIASLIESEDHPVFGDSLTGISFWGVDDCGQNGGSPFPIIDDALIAQFLSEFDIEMYDGDETGTTIIIPYVDEERLLKYVNLQEYKGGIFDYLNTSIQRWYAPRINYGHQYGDNITLDITIDGEPLEDIKFFKVINELIYDREINPDNKWQHHHDKVSISPRNKKIEVAGTIHYDIYTRDDLDMNPPNNNRCPYFYINDDNNTDGEGATNQPILCYMRSPKMVIKYEMGGRWLSHVPGTDSDKFLISVFTVQKDAFIKDVDGTGYSCSMEEYLRQTENADHFGWKDTNGGTVVKNLQDACSRILSDYIKPTTVDTGHSELNLLTGMLIAEKFMLNPANLYNDLSSGGYGNDGNVGGEPAKKGKDKTGVGKPKKGNNCVLELIGAPIFSGRYVSRDFRVVFNNKKSCNIELCIVNQDHAEKNIDKDWEDENKVGLESPVEFKSVIISKIFKGDQILSDCEVVISDSLIHDDIGLCEFKFIDTSIFHKHYALNITFNEESDYTSNAYVIEGTLNYSINNVMGTIVCRSSEDEK